eukprot:6179082-Pleurochrysis_carterae.AAC.2
MSAHRTSRISKLQSLPNADDSKFAKFDLLVSLPTSLATQPDAHCGCARALACVRVDAWVRQ